MHYYIDGYNLLFRQLHVGEDLKYQRKALTDYLQKTINVISLSATLVFDSQFQPDEGSKHYLDGLEVVFTNIGETADDYILSELKNHHRPSQCTVVTSDKKLATLSRRQLAATVSVEDFLTFINKRYKNARRGQVVPEKKKDDLAITLTSKLIPEKKSKSLSKESFAVPKKSISAQECFDYYLEAFVKEMQEAPAKKGAKLKKSKPKPPPMSPEEVYMSDMQRWQNLFEKES
jgi:predicted RNA-binding protein with PIN domain